MQTFIEWLRRFKEEVIPQWNTNREAVFAKSGLDRSDIAVLEKVTGGVYTAMEWLQKKPVKNGYSLGLSQDNEKYQDYDVAAGLTNAEYWKAAYQKYGANRASYEPDTDGILTKLAQSGSPVVFFVPDPRKGRGNTNNELKWVLDKSKQQPELLKNYHIVIGLYDLIDNDELERQAGRPFKTSHVRAAVLDDPQSHLMPGDKATIASHDAWKQVPDLEKRGEPIYNKRPGSFYVKGTQGHS